MLLLLGDGTRLPVTEFPGQGPWTFLVLAATPDPPGFLDLVDDLDQVRTRAGLGRPVLTGLGELAPLALRAAADQPWAWRALLLTPPADLAQVDLPALVLGPGPEAAVEELLGRLGPGPGWPGIAPGAPPR